MTKFARLDAAFQGRPVDRVPVSFWQHFPDHDAAAGTLAEATIAYQRRYDLDFIKLMPTGMYSVIDYGVRVKSSGDIIGTTRYAGGPIGGPEDWGRLPPVSPTRGVLADQVEVVRVVRRALGPAVPLLQTIFSPLTMAAKLAGLGGEALIALHEAALPAALGRLASDVVGFGQACLDAGADGFFFATQLATPKALSPNAYERFGVPFDLHVLSELRTRSWGAILHLHGDEPAFALADRYPVDGVNWHSRETTPTLAQGLRATGRGLVGGIARMGPVITGPSEAVAGEVKDAVAQAHGRRLVVAPGCVVPITATEEQLRALRAAVEAG